MKSIIEPITLKPEDNNYSDDVIAFIDTYISLKKVNVTESTIKKVNVVK